MRNVKSCEPKITGAQTTGASQEGGYDGYDGPNGGPNKAHPCSRFGLNPVTDTLKDLYEGGALDGERQDREEYELDESLPPAPLTSSKVPPDSLPPAPPTILIVPPSAPSAAAPARVQAAQGVEVPLAACIAHRLYRVAANIDTQVSQGVYQPRKALV